MTLDLGIILGILGIAGALYFFTIRIAKKSALTDVLSEGNKKANRFEKKLRNRKERQREELAEINSVSAAHRARGMYKSNNKKPTDS